jgi:hypothetical protein
MVSCGIKSIKTLENYIKINNDRLSETILKAWNDVESELLRIIKIAHFNLLGLH